MKKLLKKVCVPALVMGAVFILFRFVLFIGYVPTESMEPTIPKGSYIVGTRILVLGDNLGASRDSRYWKSALMIENIIALLHI